MKAYTEENMLEPPIFMDIVLLLSNMMIPFVILVIVGTGIMKKRPVYEEFVVGAKDGIKTVVEIMPTLIGLMMGIGILRSSGFFDFFGELISPAASAIHFPKELVPLSIVRLFSSSAATGLALDIYKEYGTDSFLGTATSIMMSCTETVFYTMSVYFIAAGVKKTRWTLAGGLLSTLAGIIASVSFALLTE